MKKNIIILANSGTDPNNMSGGDKIFIEYAKAWSEYAKVSILTCSELACVCSRENLECDIIPISKIAVQKVGLYIAYAMRIVKSCFKRPKIPNSSIIYSSSDFMPDVIPSLFYRLFNKTHHWIAAIYLLAPNPLKKETPLTARSMFYFWSQNISILLMKYFADQICVLNKSDVEKLVLDYKINPSKVIITRPGVTVPNTPPSTMGQYDACFVGRFHKQKGIPDLLEIWKHVCNTSTDAKLALIGSGEPEWFDFIEKYINKHKLNKNIEVLGFKDGEEKFEIMKNSKVFLFPSNYESFGIAGLEAIASGLPVVAFNIPVFKDIFKDTFSLVPLGNTKAFADEVVLLLTNQEYYKRKQEEGLNFAKSFTWKECAKDLFDTFPQASN